MTLKFINFNISSLIHQARRIELTKILQSNKCSIASIQETHLSSRHKVFIDDYNVIRNDQFQGVALCVRKNIQYEIVNFKSSFIPTIFVSIKLKQNSVVKHFLLGSIYFPTNSPPTSLRAELIKIDALAAAFDGAIIGGDLNAKSPRWGDNWQNLNGSTIISWYQSCNPSLTNITSDTPTFPRGQSFLDHFLISNHLLNYLILNFEVKTLPTFTEHCPILLTLDTANFDICLKEPQYSRSFKNTDWNVFKNDLDSSIRNFMPPHSSCLSNADIDSHIRNFNTTLIACLENNSTRNIRSFKKYDNLPSELEKLFKLKHQWQKKLKSIFHRSFNRISVPYKELSKNISLLNIIIKNKVNVWLNNQISDRLEKISPGPQAFKEVFRLIGNKKRFVCNKVTINNEVVTNEADIVSAFETHFENVYSEKIPNSNPSLCRAAILAAREVRLSKPEHIFLFDSENNALCPPCTDIFTNNETVKSIIKQLRPKKSSGPDDIPNFALKKLSNLAFNFLTILFNNCINNGYFPNSWKEARILPINKSVNNLDVNNFRPISLLSNVGKVLERIILDKMMLPSTCPVDPISDFQFGFRRGLSTVHALLKLQNDVIINLRNKQCTVACSIDVEKAFDSVWRDGLLSKLISLNFPRHIINILESFLSNRSFFIQIQGTISQLRECNSGVPQGSILGPQLYNIFLHDFPHQFSENNLTSIGLLYADDTIVYSSHEFPIIASKTVEKHIQIINDYYQSWGIKINSPKTEMICFRNASGKGPEGVARESKNIKIKINDTTILPKNTLKYLGVNFNNLFKFNKHARITIEKSRKISNMLMFHFRHKNLSKKCKLLFYKTLVRPIMSYAFPIWFSISPTVAGELEILERKILRCCAGINFESRTKRYSNSHLHKENNTIPFLRYVLLHMQNTISRLHLVDNALIDQILNSQSESSWDNVNYLSPIGASSLVLDTSVITPPQFYLTTTPNQNRG